MNNVHFAMISTTLCLEMDVTHTSVFTALGLEKLEKDLLNFTILSKVVFEHAHYTCNI